MPGGVVIRSKRLELRPIDFQAACALKGGTQFGDCAWADGYPTAMTQQLADDVCERHGVGIATEPFVFFQMVRRADEHVVGDCGFVDQPDGEGIVEVSFAVAASAQGRGYEAEALEALIGFAFTRDEVMSVRASASTEDGVTRAMLEKAGMMPVGEHAGWIRFEA